MPPRLRKMPPLAAAATECRFSGGRARATVRRETNDPATTGRPCSVRLYGDLVLTYVVCAVGGRRRVVREDPPRSFDKLFCLYEPADAFFRSFRACSDVIDQMLAQTPVVGEFDLADGNCADSFLPHDLARAIVGGCRCAMDQNMRVAPRFDVDVSLALRATAVYSEPRALLRACQQTTAARRRLVAAAGLVENTAAGAECCVCMEDIAAPNESTDDTVTMLPCSHVFHSACLLPWFHRVSTCPTCRRDMASFLLAVTRTPKGRFPGLEARVTP